jgi:sugar-phosphatase
MPIFNCSAILFDLDGVLVDSTGSVDRQWREWGRAKGIDGDKIMAIAHGVRSLEVIRRVAPHLNAETEVEELENREADDHEGVSVMPGAADLLSSIPEGRWCVVTSGGRHLASARLAFCGLPVPKILVTADDVTNGKPHPEPYLKGAKQLGFAPEDCLVIEDAPAGIQAAHAGGMRVIGMASTYTAEKLSEADAVVGRLAQIQVASNGAGKLRVEIR